MRDERDLDVLIAERVLNWTRREPRTWPDGSFTGWGWRDNEYSTFYPDREDGPSIPWFSSDIGAAWDVVERLSKIRPEFWFSITRIPDGEGWYVENGPDRETVSEAETAPKAICLAALKVIEWPL